MPLSLATFNVRNLFDHVPPHVIGQLDRDGFNAWAQKRARALYARKLEAIAATLSRMNADLVALQEVEGQRVLEDLRALLPSHGYAHLAAGAQDERGISCGVLSRFPLSGVEIHGVGELTFPTFADGDPRAFQGRLRSRRGVLEVNAALPDGTALCALVLHLKSARALPRLGANNAPVDFDGHFSAAEGAARATVLRIAEALHVRSLVEARLMRDSRMQLAVLGDFNEEPSSVVVRAIAGEIADAPRGRGVEVEQMNAFETGVLHHCARAVAPSSRHTILFRGAGQQVDHILVSRSLWKRFSTARILNERLRDCAFDAREEVESDHAPMVAEFH